MCYETLHLVFLKLQAPCPWSQVIISVLPTVTHIMSPYFTDDNLMTPINMRTALPLGLDKWPINYLWNLPKYIFWKWERLDDCSGLPFHHLSLFLAPWDCYHYQMGWAWKDICSLKALCLPSVFPCFYEARVIFQFVLKKKRGKKSARKICYEKTVQLSLKPLKD